MLAIRRLGPGDEERVLEASALFDDPPHLRAVTAFLENNSNYLLIAYLDGQPAGFVSGHLLPRLDTEKPMLFLYEAGVGGQFQGRGIGTALVAELSRLGQEHGCREMFVLTNRSNPAAMRMYAKAGGERSAERDTEMYEWLWDMELP